MHSECNHQKAREVGMSQPQWDVWPSGSPDLPDSIAPEQEVAVLSSTEDCGKQIQLPKQLETVRKATEFPFERHRWNTNEEVAAILIAFDKHESWEKQEVRARPPSGTMLLYSRKKVRYRKDGYCWKKRKDGKTTREDHMKLKVQGIECIYGSYVHSAILPTFHRRCYWLLQNPDLVLVHYLNVPLTDDNKICLPPILQVDCKDWSHDDLVSQLRPMFASVKHFETASNVNETSEDAIESLVKHIFGNSASSSGSNQVHLTASAMPRTTVETLRNTSSSDQKMAPSSAPNTMHNRLLQLIYSHKISPGAAASASVPCVVGAASHQQMSPSQIGLAVCEPHNGTTVLHGLKSNATLSSGHKVLPHNGPLILNVSPLPGSKGLLILSSQAATAPKGSLSVLHQAPVGGRIDVATSKEVADRPGSLQADYGDLAKKNFQPIFSGLGSDNVRAHCESTAVGNKAAPCYGVVSDFLNHGDILGEFDLQQVVKTEAKDGRLHSKATGHIPEFSSGSSSCGAEFSRGSCVRDPGSVEETDAHDLNQIGMDSMEFLFGDSGLADDAPSSLISENDIKCEFYHFHESSSSDVGNHGNTETIGSGASAGASCLADTMDTSLAAHEKDLDDMKVLHGSDLMMDELEDILHIVSESLGSSIDLTNTFSLSDDPGSSATAMSSLYQCGDVSGSSLSGSRGQVLSVEKLKTCLDVVQNDTGDDQLFGLENGKAGLLEITDYCPEWSYTEGGTKVLVTGPWHQTSSSYSVLFDDLSVPTSMVQGGVLRCFAPAHSPAVVCLHVAYNGQVISEPKVFEYKSRDQVETGNETDWFLVQERQLKESLVQRFVEVENSLMDDQAASLSTSLPLEVTEGCLVGLVDRLAERPSALHCSPPVESLTRMTLLHLSAALGFNRLLSALIKWRNNNACLVLEQEVDSLSVDSKGNTPLMWACARGHTESVAVLAHWSPSSLQNSNKANWRPMTILEHFGHRSIVELLQQINASGQTSSLLDSLTTLEHPDSFRQLLTDDNFDGSAKSTTATDYLSLDGKPVFSQLFSGLPSAGSESVIPAKREFPPPCDSDKDGEYWRAVDAPPQHSLRSSPQAAPSDVGTSEDTCPLVLIGGATKGSGALKRTRLMKRTSVDILPDYPQFHNDLPKLSRTGAHPDGDEDGDTFEGQMDEHAFMAGLRASSSDPHLANLERSSPLGSGSGGDPMISRIDRDLNSPVLFLQTSASFDEDKGLSLEDIQRETVAMDMDSPNNLEGLSRDDVSDMLQSASVEADDHSNQMMTLASQIIAAMPERIKISPSHSKHLLMDEINSRRDRTSSYGSFSSCSSSTPPVCITEDSGISTPLEGMSFLEYRYSDMGTPTSTLSPTSTCMQSPYSFGLDSPPPTTAEFTEYFNAPAMYMEKDFSQLTLSDEEQRRLYEAAKIIQNFYRKYKDKKEQQMRQQQKEIEAAILIQSYYRRYKQFMYYKRMTQAAVLIQSQFRSYYAQKCFRRSREAATIIQNRYRAYKEHERYKKSRNAAVIIQQRFRSHYQRTLAGRQSSLASTVHKMMADSDVSSDSTDAREPGIGDTNPNQNSSDHEEIRVTANEDVKKTSETVATAVSSESSDCSSCKKEIPSATDEKTQRL